MKVVGRGKWVGMDIYAGKDLIVIRVDNMRRDYDRVEGGIGMSYDEIKGVTMSVSRYFHMLSKITCLRLQTSFYHHQTAPSTCIFLLAFCKLSPCLIMTTLLFVYFLSLIT